MNSVYVVEVVDFKWANFIKLFNLIRHMMQNTDQN